MDNKVVVHYDKGPAEKLENWLKKYHVEVKQGMDKALVAWVASIAKVNNSRLGQIFNSVETQVYLEDLEEFSPHFMVDEFYSQKFCVEFLHQVNGAVSGSIVCHAV